MESHPLTKAVLSWAKGRRQVRLSIPLNPVPAARPRVSKFGSYYPKTYAQWKREAPKHLPSGIPLFQEGTLVVCCAVHWVQKARTSKLLTPTGDTDNYMKAAMDAITKAGGVWADDKQVVIELSRKEFTLEAPHTDILVVEVNGKETVQRKR